jgi:hypothetical protein
MAGGRPQQDLPAVVIARAALRSMAQICGDLAAHPGQLPPDATWRRLIQLVNTCDLEGRAVFGGSAVGRAYGDDGVYIGLPHPEADGAEASMIPNGRVIFGSPPADLFTAVSDILGPTPATPDDVTRLSAHVEHLGQVIGALGPLIDLVVDDPQGDLDRVLRSASIAGARKALDHTVPRSLLTFLADD